MKTVFNNSDLCHVFNQQTQNYGRGSSMFFENNKIYSYGYHYLIAEIFSDYILINDTGYSSSTGKHINYVIAATRNRKQFFKTNTDLETVYKTVKNDLVKKLAVARKPEKYINEIFSLFSSLTNYIEFTEAKNYKSTVEFKYLKNLVSKLEDNSVEFKAILEAQAKKDKQAKQRKEKQLLKEKLQKFRSYEINTFRIGENDFLRLSKNKENVETSQGVKVSIIEAKRLLKLIEYKKIIGAKVNEMYIVTAFNGLLKVGCHNIPINEINNIKQVLNA